jgi:hypothetical protein
VRSIVIASSSPFTVYCMLKQAAKAPKAPKGDAAPVIGKVNHSYLLMPVMI